VIVGAVSAALLLVIAVVVLFAGRDAPLEEGGGGGGAGVTETDETPTTEDVTETGDTPVTEEVPESGSVRRQLQEEAGEFRIREATAAESLPTGATESYVVTYAAGTRIVVHGVSAFASVVAANDDRERTVEAFAQAGFRTVEERPILIDGEQVGNVNLMRNDAERQEVLVWRNADLSCVVLGAFGDATSVYENLRY